MYVRALFLLKILFILLNDHTLGGDIRLILKRTLNLHTMRITRKAGAGRIMSGIARGSSMERGSTSRLSETKRRTDKDRMRQDPGNRSRRRTSDRRNPPSTTTLNMILVLLRGSVQRHMSTVLLNTLLDLTNTLLLFERTLRILTLLRLFTTYLEQDQRSTSETHYLANKLNKYNKLTHGPNGLIKLHTLIHNTANARLYILLRTYRLKTHSSLRNLTVTLKHTVSSLNKRIQNLPHRVPINFRPVTSRLLIMTKLGLTLLMTNNEPRATKIEHRTLISRHGLTVSSARLRLNINGSSTANHYVLNNDLMSLRKGITGLHNSILTRSLTTALRQSILIIIASLNLHKQHGRQLKGLKDLNRTLERLSTTSNTILIMNLLTQANRVTTSSTLSEGHLNLLGRRNTTNRMIAVLDGLPERVHQISKGRIIKGSINGLVRPRYQSTIRRLSLGQGLIKGGRIRHEGTINNSRRRIFANVMSVAGLTAKVQAALRHYRIDRSLPGCSDGTNSFPRIFTGSRQRKQGPSFAR